MNENNSEEKKEKTPSEQKEEKSRDDFSEENNHKVIDTFPPPPLEKPKDKDDKKQVDCIANERHNLLFSVRRSVRYHNRRILFYDHLHKLAISLALLSSSATVVAVLSRLNPFYVTILALIVVFFSAIDLVVCPDKAARMHNDLSREFFNLEKSIITTKNTTKEALIDLQARRLDIEMTEPPIKKVLDAICHNELCRAMGIKNSTKEIKWYQRLCCQIFDLREYAIKPMQ